MPFQERAKGAELKHRETECAFIDQHIPYLPSSQVQMVQMARESTLLQNRLTFSYTLKDWVTELRTEQEPHTHVSEFIFDYNFLGPVLWHSVLNCTAYCRAGV